MKKLMTASILSLGLISNGSALAQSATTETTTAIDTVTKAVEQVEAVTGTVKEATNSAEAVTEAVATPVDEQVINALEGVSDDADGRKVLMQKVLSQDPAAAEAIVNMVKEMDPNATEEVLSNPVALREKLLMRRKLMGSATTQLEHIESKSEKAAEAIMNNPGKAEEVLSEKIHGGTEEAEDKVGTMREKIEVKKENKEKFMGESKDADESEDESSEEGRMGDKKGKVKDTIEKERTSHKGGGKDKGEKGKGKKD